jgi:hypothetical protein
VISLATRPVLFALARVLAEARPADASRGTLVALAFRGKLADESHRARLRVEVGRLRTALRTLAGVSVTSRGFVLVPRDAREVVLLARPVEEQHAAVLAFLADGESCRARRWRSRLEPASVPCSGRSMSLRRQARCSRLAAGERVAG